MPAFPPPSLQGFVDGFDDGVLFGWAARPGDSRPVTVEILRDGRSLGTAVASLYREDLKKAGIGAGRHGFEFRLPAAERTPGTFTLDVRDVESGAPLERSPFTATEDPTRVLSGARLRRFLADQYFTGRGLEIGALHRPMPVPAAVAMSYADSFSTDELVRLWSPEVDGHEVAPVDVITDATTLGGIADGTYDFIIASHVIEHLEDPIRCLMNLARATRPGGCVFLALPDRRATFDRDRPPTSIAHVLRDYCGHPEASRHAHYEEWVRVVERLAGDEARARVQHLESTRYPIHFHVWTPGEFSSLLDELRDAVGLKLTVDLFKAHGAEGIWVLRAE
jgi:SAM-dependent methyltransferase